MCLTSPKQIKVVKPIRIYKVVMRIPATDAAGNPIHKYVYKTPFFNTYIADDIINGIRPFVAQDPNYVGNRDVIKGGYIHAYRSLKTAVSEYKSYFSTLPAEYPGVKYLIYQCEIPVSEDNRYCYIGYFDGDHSTTAIAARQIIFKKEVSWEQIDKKLDFEQRISFQQTDKK